MQAGEAVSREPHRDRVLARVEHTVTIRVREGPHLNLSIKIFNQPQKETKLNEMHKNIFLFSMYINKSLELVVNNNSVWWGKMKQPSNERNRYKARTLIGPFVDLTN